MGGSVMERFVGRFKQLAWFLPGFLLWAAFPPMGERMDVLFALAPLMVVARKGDSCKSAQRWFQSGIFFWVATLSWMPAIVKNNGPWPLVVLGWFALAAYCAAYFAAYGWLSARYWRWAREGGWARRLVGVLFAEPVLWCGLELIRSRFLGGFAWNQLGVVAANSGFGGPAALGGVYLLSAAVVLVNGTVAGIAERVIASVRARMGRSHDAAALARWRSLETLMAFALIWGVYGAARAAEITGKAEIPTHAVPPCGGTVYLCTADGEGNMVSYIQSNYNGFGSGVVLEGYGVALQNRGADFSLDPKAQNVLAPGKKSYHTIIPGFLTKDGTAVGPFGVMGAYMQPQGHVQVVQNLIDHGLNPQMALDAPRWQWIREKTVLLEPEYGSVMARQLAARGHDVSLAMERTSFGRGQMILRLPNGVLVGGTESRTDSNIFCW